MIVAGTSLAAALVLFIIILLWTGILRVISHFLGTYALRSHYEDMWL